MCNTQSSPSLSIMKRCDDYERIKKYAADYRRRHPERVKQWNINKSINLLRKNGYTIIPPSTDKSPAAMEGGAVNG